MQDSSQNQVKLNELKPTIKQFHPHSKVFHYF